MRKFTKSLLTLALLVLAVGGAKAGVEVKIPIELTGAVSGVTVKAINPETLEELAENPEHIYAAKFTTSAELQNVIQMKDLSTVDAVAAGCDRIIIEFGAAVDNAWRFHSYGGQFDGIEEIGGETTHTLMLDGSKSSIDDFTIFNWAGSGVKEIIIKAAYFYKRPFTSLEFNAFGEATIGKGDLTATGGLSYDASTGVLTSDGTKGELVLEFATPVDLSYLIHYEVKRSGTDGIISRLKFYEEDNTTLINTWNSIKLDNNWQMPAGIDNNATNAFLDHKPVKKLVWESDAEDSNAGKTLTINSIEFTLKTISCARAGETQLNTLAWNKTDGTGTAIPDWYMNVENDTYYGDYSSNPTHYVDLTTYEELRIYRDDNTGFRAFFINSTGSATNEINNGNAASSWNADGKYWSINLSKIEKWDSKVALKSIKSASSGVKNIVRNIVAYTTPAANAPQYTLTGSGMQLAETVAALADANATCIDATGVIGNTTNSEAGRTQLTSANPNCLFLGKVGNGYLSNTKNVVDGSTCDNLVLADGYPFKAIADFTATSASYTTTINTTAKAGTLCLPFAATIPVGVEAWTLNYTAGKEAVKATEVTTTIPANTPVLLNGNGSADFTGSSVDIDADATNVSGALTGVFNATTVPENSYVLQNGTNGIGFYKVTSDNIVANPFRAYLTADGLGAPSLHIIFPEEGDVTGIESVKAAEVKGEFFNLAGQRVAQPAKGLYIVNGKKVIFK